MSNHEIDKKMGKKVCDSEPPSTESNPAARSPYCTAGILSDLSLRTAKR